MSVPRAVLRRTYATYVFVLTRLLAFALPKRFWYPVAFRLCSLQGRILRPLLAYTPFRNDYRRRMVVTFLVQSILWRLIDMGQPFPIPIRTKNLETLLEAQKNPKGLVLCSVHLPLVWLTLRGLVEAGVPPTAVVTNDPMMDEGKVNVWGATGTLPGLRADASVLVRARSILRHGGQITTLVDLELGYPLNCNVFRFIRLVGACLIFFTIELLPSGEIMVEFFAPPDPFCQSDESVVSDLLALQSRVTRVLQLSSGQPAIETLPIKGNAGAGVAYLQLNSSFFEATS
jgi:hypothetical protein